jgi:hypothetical protein
MAKISTVSTSSSYRPEAAKRHSRTRTNISTNSRKLVTVTTWFVCSSRPFAGPEQVLAYPATHVGRSMNFETAPRGAMSKRGPQIILRIDERHIVLELEREGKFATKSSGRDEDRISSRSSNSRSRTGAGW